MTLDALIMFAGAFVTVLPFLGFPNSWDNVLLFIVGVFTLVLGIVVRRRSARAYYREESEAFVESLPGRQASVRRVGHEA